MRVPLAAGAVACCAALLVPLDHGAAAQSPSDLYPGRIVRVRTAALGRAMTGTVQRFDDDSLHLTLRNGSQLDVPATAINSLQVNDGRASSAGRGAIIGGGVGLGLGIFVGIAAQGIAEGLCESGCGESSRAGSAILGGAAGTAMGAGLGALVGSLFKHDRWRPVVSVGRTSYSRRGGHSLTLGFSAGL
jgi:hypothetical protein